jgi:hypothetical protein
MARLLRIFAAPFWLAAVGLLLLYTVGRTATDRFHLTQFIYWLPGWWLLGGATIAAFLAAFIPALSERLRAARFERFVRRFLALNLALAWGYFALGECRLHATLFPPPPPPPTAPTLTLAHWNAMSPFTVPGPNLFRPVTDAATHHTGRPLDALFLSAAMDDAQLQTAGQALVPDGAPLHVERRGVFAVVSRLPIRSLRFHTLNLAGPVAFIPDPKDPNRFPVTTSDARSTLEYVFNTYGPSIGLQRRIFRNADPGHLLVVELDPPAPRIAPVTVWYFDLPSDPLRSKWELAGVLAHNLARLQAEHNLPDPDVALGDLNIPRGSASIPRALPRLQSAFSQAGWGFAATWPYAHPAIQIDHAFAGPTARATRFGTIDTGTSDHLAVFAQFALTP